MRRIVWGSVGLLLVCLLAGGGCQRSWVADQLPTHVSGTTSEPELYTLAWEKKGEGIERAEVAFSSSTASTMLLYRFEIKHYTFAFQQATSTASVAEWLARTPDAVFVANGVYFHEDYSASGWLKSGGRVVGSRMFDADKSALLSLHPSVSISVTPDAQASARQIATEAAQSYPVLLQRGQPVVKVDSGKASRRTFVGIDQSHAYFYVGIVPYTSVSLYELAHILGKLPIAWDTALNMDGGPSSGVAIRTSEGFEAADSYVTVPNVLTVLPRTP